MDFALGVSTNSSTKKRAVGEVPADLKQVVKVMAKLSLSNAQQSRMLKSILIECYKLDSSNDIITKMKEATKLFASKAKELREERGLTSEAVRAELATPAVHCFNAILNATITAKKLDKDPQIIKFREYYQSKGVGELARYVKHFKVANMFDKKAIRLEIHLSQEDHFQDHPGSLPDPRELFFVHVLPHLRTLKGFHILQGMAPAGDLERQIQDRLDKEHPI